MKNKLFKINEDIEIEQFDDETLVLIFESSNFFKINKLGTEILQFIKEKKTFDEIIDLIAKKYTASKAEIKKDVVHFLEELKSEKIIL